MTLYALIMAGGTGTRLWPRSRTRHPKQFLDIIGGATMLQEARRRIGPIINPEDTLIATNQDYVEMVAQQCPEIPFPNILGEPVGRGTAAAIGYAAVHIRKRDPDAVMAVLTADHMIHKVDMFRKALESAAYIAQDHWLVTLGIKPAYPETGYGYIERGEILTRHGFHDVFRVRRFVEKPNQSTAEKYLSQGNYDWNSGMFIWRVSTILDEMAAQMPVLYAGLQEIESSIGTAEENTVLENVFPSLEKNTIDYGIMERADRVATIPVEIGWNDVGSWSAVYDVLPRDAANNVVVGRHLSPDTRNSLVFSPNDRLVATIGLKDIVIVDTDDVLLICPRARAQEVKTLVDMLKSNGETNYLHGATDPKPLSNEELGILNKEATRLEKLMLSLMLHSGVWPSSVTGSRSEDYDLLQGWLQTPQGKRPLADSTRQAVFAWMQAENTLKFSLSDYWKTSEEVKTAVAAIGKRAGLKVSVDDLYETLARALFETSEEGEAIRGVLGREIDMVRVPLHAMFPFSIADFTGNENNALGSRARDALNRAVGLMMDESDQGNSQSSQR